MIAPDVEDFRFECSSKHRKYGYLDFPLDRQILKIGFPKLRKLDILLTPVAGYDLVTIERNRDDPKAWTDSLFPAVLDHYPSVEAFRFSFPTLELYEGFEQIARLREFHIHCLKGSTLADLERVLTAIFSQETLNLEVLTITCANDVVDIPTDAAYWNGRLRRSAPITTLVFLS